MIRARVLHVCGCVGLGQVRARVMCAGDVCGRCVRRAGAKIRSVKHILNSRSAPNANACALVEAVEALLDRRSDEPPLPP